MLRLILSLASILLYSSVTYTQSDRWQQSVKYKMDIDFILKKHQFKGTQILEFTNNSPDTLFKVFYHLYYNAFQPNSMMDVRSRTIIDPDPRIGDRISMLKKEDQGHMLVSSLKLNGRKVKFKTVGTILEVHLDKPVLPKTTVTFEMKFKGKIPLQIRRTGRFNKEGIEYSMAQWYPKMCNYDHQGWHADPYVAAEFYGIWGDYDVTITMPKEYIIAATGILQNRDDIEFGHANKDSESRPDKLTWHFKAENVHDFVWAADPDYHQMVHKAYDGTLLRFFYQPGEKTTQYWDKLPPIMDEVLSFANSKYGKYAFPEYSFIQGGDGGMEYPMATLITGERSMISLVGVCVHEFMHSWFHTMLASNESLYAWMDEGFASYAANEVMNHLKMKKLIPGDTLLNPHIKEVVGYINFSKSGYEEPMSTHSDHFSTNTAYGMAAAKKGEVLLEQLRYIIGTTAFDKGMLVYFDTWKFKHPNPNDFIRLMEKVSGLELDWFKEYFVQTTHTIDYAIEEVKDRYVVIKNIGLMPMPLDISVTTNDGKVHQYYIPQEIMRGEKKGDVFFDNFKIMPDWSWTHPTYKLIINQKLSEIKSVEIDVSQRLADVDRENNILMVNPAQED